jgi:hypothetical protein
MPIANHQGYCPGLVDLASGQISREIFVNAEIYAEEQERIFARSWLFVGHESQIPYPGDPLGPLGFWDFALGGFLSISNLVLPDLS